MEDIVKSLGHLALGTRLKRVSEQLQRQAQEVLESFGVTVTAAHFPVLAALDRLGPASVSVLAEALGVAQPGVTRALNKLEAEGLVEAQDAGSDRRVRTVKLSATGARLIKRAKAVVWPAVERAVADACRFPDGPLLDQIGKLEAALERRRLIERAPRRRRAS
ncbi:MAG: MarR family winged helix-turn-helix transcriptional regulator [Vitreimonas sp.]